MKFLSTQRSVEYLITNQRRFLSCLFKEIVGYQFASGLIGSSHLVKY